MFAHYTNKEKDMAIERIDKNLPMSERIDKLNDQTLELSGKTEQAKFDVNEITNLFSGSGLGRKFIRNFSFSATTGAGAWFNWEHLRAESGYSIWKFVTGAGSYSYLPNAVNQLYLDNKIMNYKGTATAENITAFESVFVYDGLTYTDNTIEAGTEAGNPFDILSDTGDFIYIGSASQFSGIRFLLDSKGSGYTLEFEYSIVGGWEELLTTEHSLVDATGNLRRDAAITFTHPGNWASTTVNGQARYWIRISTTQAPVTEATAFAILPYNSVPTLLALSSLNIKNESWAFCDLNSIVYATFRNTGDSSYEGSRFVASSSSLANKQNFFRFNHTILGDFQNLNYNYTGSGLSVMRSDGSAPARFVEPAGGPVMDLTGIAASGKTGAGIYVPLKWNDQTYYIQLWGG